MSGPTRPVERAVLVAAKIAEPPVSMWAEAIIEFFDPRCLTDSSFGPRPLHRWAQSRALWHTALRCSKSPLV